MLFPSNFADMFLIRNLQHFIAVVWLFSCFHLNAEVYDASVGWSKPPYVIERNNSGFELELVQGIFKNLGHELNIIYVPFGRSNVLLQSGKVDLTLTMSEKLDTDQIELSDPYITYQNVVISIKERNIELQGLEQLRHYSIVAFQNANIVLGEKFHQVSQQSPLYVELPNQSKQVEMFLKRKVDLVVMDINIFLYLRREMAKQYEEVAVEVHHLFSPIQYRIGFKNVELKDAFNAELARYKVSTKYQQLLQKYDFYQ